MVKFQIVFLLKFSSVYILYSVYDGLALWCTLVIEMLKT